MDRYDIILGKEPPPFVVIEDEGSPQAVEPPQESQATEFLQEFLQESPQAVNFPQTTGSPQTTSNSVNREEIYREFLRTGEGRQRLATSLTMPMRRRLDFGSIARRIFSVDPLGPGALPIYDTDGMSIAIGENGGEIIQVPRNGLIPMFENISRPSILVSQLRRGRLNLVDQAQNSAFNEISGREGRGAWLVLESAVNAVHPRDDMLPRHLTASDLTPQVLAEAFVMIERNDLRVGSLFMHAREYADMRLTMRDIIDTNREMLAIGLIGSVWGASIFVSSDLFPPGRMYLTAEPAFVGLMPLRDLVVLSADNPLEMTVGWVMYENVGICCTNLLGVACVDILR